MSDAGNPHRFRISTSGACCGWTDRFRFWANQHHVPGSTRYYVSDTDRPHRFKVSTSPQCCGWTDRLSFYAFNSPDISVKVRCAWKAPETSGRTPFARNKVCEGIAEVSAAYFSHADVGKNIEIRDGKVKLDGVNQAVKWGDAAHPDCSGTIKSVDHNLHGIVKLRNKATFQNPPAAGTATSADECKEICNRHPGCSYMQYDRGGACKLFTTCRERQPITEAMEDKAAMVSASARSSGPNDSQTRSRPFNHQTLTS